MAISNEAVLSSEKNFMKLCCAEIGNKNPQTAIRSSLDDCMPEHDILISYTSGKHIQKRTNR